MTQFRSASTVTTSIRKVPKLRLFDPATQDQSPKSARYVPPRTMMSGDRKGETSAPETQGGGQKSPRFLTPRALQTEPEPAAPVSDFIRLDDETFTGRTVHGDYGLAPDEILPEVPRHGLGGPETRADAHKKSPPRFVVPRADSQRPLSVPVRPAEEPFPSQNIADVEGDERSILTDDSAGMIVFPRPNTFATDTDQERPDTIVELPAKPEAETIRQEVKKFFSMEASYFSTKYKEGNAFTNYGEGVDAFRKRVHKWMLTREHFLMTFASRTEAQNEKLLLELAFELAHILEFRDNDGWTKKTKERTDKAGFHYVQPAINANFLVSGSSAAVSFLIAAVALTGSSFAVGATSLGLGVAALSIFPCASLWQAKMHPIGLQRLAMQGPMGMPAVRPRDVTDLKGNSAPLRISYEIRREIAIVEVLLNSSLKRDQTLRTINHKVKELLQAIAIRQQYLAEKGLLNKEDQQAYREAEKAGESDVVQSLMFLASKQLKEPGRYLKLLELKRDLALCRELLPINWRLDPTHRPLPGRQEEEQDELHLLDDQPQFKNQEQARRAAAFREQPNRRGLPLSNPPTLVEAKLQEKLHSLKLALLLSKLYRALNIQPKQSSGRGFRALMNLLAAALGLAGPINGDLGDEIQAYLPQEYPFGVHPSTFGLASGMVTLTQAAVFRLTQESLAGHDQRTRLTAMLMILILARTGDPRTEPADLNTEKLRQADDPENPIDPTRLDLMVQGWGKVRCLHFARILEFDRDCYILALITHILPSTPSAQTSRTKPFKLNAQDDTETWIPETAEDLLVLLRKCKSDYREELIKQLAPAVFHTEKSRKAIRHLLEVIRDLEAMAADAKAMKVDRILANEPKADRVRAKNVERLQPTVRDIFEQSLLYARSEFLQEKAANVSFSEVGPWTKSELEKADLALGYLRGMVDALTEGAAEPELAQKGGQHNANYAFGSFSPQLIKLVGLAFSGIALMASQAHTARILAMFFSSTAMWSAVMNFALVYAYHNNIALKFAQQNRNQALGTVDVPNTGPWPFKSQFKTLAAQPIAEEDLGDGKLNLQSDLSIIKDLRAQMQAAPFGGFKNREGKWVLPLRNWFGYFSKEPEDLDSLTLEQVQKDLKAAYAEVKQVLDEGASDTGDDDMAINDDENRDEVVGVTNDVQNVEDDYVTINDDYVQESDGEIQASYAADDAADPDDVGRALIRQATRFWGLPDQPGNRVPIET